MREALGHLFEFLYLALLYSGMPFVALIAQVKTFGDGTGNESGMIEGHLWALVCGLILWVALAAGGYWVWNHVPVTVQ